MSERLPNLYTVDLIFPEDNPETPQIIDVHGSIGGGFPELRKVYGGKERIDRYLLQLSKAADDGGILQLYGFWHKKLSGICLPQSLMNLIMDSGGFLDWMPEMKSLFERAKSRNEENEEAELFDSSAHRLGLQYFHGDFLKSENGFLTVKNQRKRYKDDGDDFPLDEISLIVFRGSYEMRPEFIQDSEHYPEGVQVVNHPLADLLLQTKWNIPYLMENTEHAQYFTPQMNIGMGTCTLERFDQFVTEYGSDNFPKFVRKPSHGRFGVSVRYLGSTELDDVRQIIDRKVELDDVFQREGKGFETDPEYLKFYLGPKSTVVLQNKERRIGDLSDAELQGLCGIFKAVKIQAFEHGTNIMQPYVHAKPVISQVTGKLHRGYVRAIVCGDSLLGAYHRFPHQSIDEGFVDLNRPEVRTFVQRVTDTEETLLERILVPMFGYYEEAISGVQDVSAVRRRVLTG